MHTWLCYTRTAVPTYHFSIIDCDIIVVTIRDLLVIKISASGILGVAEAYVRPAAPVRISMVVTQAITIMRILCVTVLRPTSVIIRIIARQYNYNPFLVFPGIGNTPIWRENWNRIGCEVVQATTMLLPAIGLLRGRSANYQTLTSARNRLTKLSCPASVSVDSWTSPCPDRKG